MRDDLEHMCRTIEQCMPASPYREQVVQLHNLLLENIAGYDEHLRSMQRDCVKYLSIDNTACNKDWFVSRVIWHLDGPKQRLLQGPKCCEKAGPGQTVCYYCREANGGAL